MAKSEEKKEMLQVYLLKGHNNCLLTQLKNSRRRDQMGELSKDVAGTPSEQRPILCKITLLIIKSKTINSSSVRNHNFRQIKCVNLSKIDYL